MRRNAPSRHAERGRDCDTGGVGALDLVGCARTQNTCIAVAARMAAIGIKLHVTRVRHGGTLTVPNGGDKFGCA